ncbi:MAG: response regulator [Candidatus Omnitrophica bacterium]|nr:response regulator [Candidatus Omnitrophota bacterium]
MNHKILICDDEDTIRETLKFILGDFYSLFLVNSVEQALYTLENNTDIQITLLDIKMPKGKKLDALKEIKSRFPHIKIIMITGYRSVETAAEASRLGAVGYIVKPFKAEEILETVRKVTVLPS